MVPRLLRRFSVSHCPDLDKRRAAELNNGPLSNAAKPTLWSPSELAAMKAIEEEDAGIGVAGPQQ
jgi:hypothetical protein